MRRGGLACAAAVALFTALPCELFAAEMRVGAAVADLRREPVEPGPTLEQDPLQESQLLYGDRVDLLEEREGWAQVAAPDQPEWSHSRRWEGYPGWVKRSALVEPPADWEPNAAVVAKLARVRTGPEPEAPVALTLSFGSRLMSGQERTGWTWLRLLDGTEGWLPAEEVRRLPKGWRDLAWGDLPADLDSGRLRGEIVRLARLFLGDPYYWGGRSSFHPAEPPPPHTAVDCSGLVGLLFQANGLTVPRDAHEIWMKARPVARENLEPGDLLFLADPKDARRMTHVALYIGEGRILEAPGTGRQVREITLEDRLSESPDRQAHFGSTF